MPHSNESKDESPVTPNLIELLVMAIIGIFDSLIGETLMPHSLSERDEKLMEEEAPSIVEHEVYLSEDILDEFI